MNGRVGFVEEGSTEATPQNEIDKVCWVTVEAALATLTYARDFVVVEAAEVFAPD